MSYPSLVFYNSEAEYRDHFKKTYCSKPIMTFDNIAVRFKKNNFDHAFFESVHKKDDTFSNKRAERINWIKDALEDPNSKKRQGWDSKHRRYDASRRVTIVMGNYVVVIAIKKKKRAYFVTAYLADKTGREGQLSTIQKIDNSPEWK